MSVLGVAVLVAVVVVAARWLYPRLKARTPKGRERAQLQALLQACHGDEHVAERLIFAEMQQDHDISFERAARRARKRLLRDRRR
jgi:hypothetical protein